MGDPTASDPTASDPTVSHPTAANPPATGTHREHESHPWTISIPDHPAREETPAFRAAKALADKIMTTLSDFPYGPGNWQMHHGGSLWTFDDEGWFLVLNSLGSEWAAQWCADPKKIDAMRRNATRHYAAYPKTIPKMVEMGYGNAAEILNTPITDPAQVSVYVDSIFNSCVPMAASVHTGVLSPSSSLGGIHHYPKPIVDIQFFKRDDFQLWVVDDQGQAAAVAPLSPRGSGDGRVQVLWATPNTRLDEAATEAQSKGQMLILPPQHTLAQQAFFMQRGS